MLGWIDNYVLKEGGEEGKEGAGTKIKNKERKSKGELTVLCQPNLHFDLAMVNVSIVEPLRALM